MTRCLECYKQYKPEYPEQRICRSCSDWISGEEDKRGGIDNDSANIGSWILYGKKGVK